MNGKLIAKLKKLGTSGRAVQSKIMAISLDKLEISERTQRRLRLNRVKELKENFSLSYLGLITVSIRNGINYIIDGHHRCWALRELLGEETNVPITCLVYQGLSEAEEADLFDRLNDALAVSAIEKHKVRVVAKRKLESAIEEVVTKNDYKVSDSKEPGNISAVATLCRIFRRGGAELLNRTLQIGTTCFGDQFGKESRVMDGLSLLMAKYNERVLPDEAVIAALRKVRGGLSGLITAGVHLKNYKHTTVAKGIAVYLSEIVNKGITDKGKKLPDWWKVHRRRSAARDVRSQISTSV